MWVLYQWTVPAQQQSVLKIFEVKEGAAGDSVARSLEEEGLIRSGLAFRVLIRVKGEDAILKPGFYELDPSKPTLAIFEHLIKGETLTRKATIPEGLTIEQIAVALEKQEVAPAEQVYQAASKNGGRFGEIFPDSLEGYLLPDTYEFPWQADGEQVVAILTAHFSKAVDPLWQKHKGKTGLSLRETVILASMVEREAQVASERPIIAGVYVNRLKKDMKLQCDATVQYALGKPKAVLLYADLENPSPYNTYRYPGLPPGPIACPGIASIEAAMNPKASDYLFYVRNDVKNDGSHVFAKDYAGHQRNIAKYQR